MSSFLPSAPPSLLTPEERLVVHSLRSTSLAPLSEALQLFPDIDLSKKIIGDASAWSLFLFSDVTFLKTDDYYRATRLMDKRNEIAPLYLNATRELDHASFSPTFLADTLAARLFKSLGDPWTTLPYSESTHSEVDAFYRAQRPTHLEYHTVPIHVRRSPAWMVLFHAIQDRNGYGTGFMVSLAKAMLRHPSAKSTLDDWYRLYKLHPISISVKENRTDLLKVYLDELEVDPNLQVCESYMVDGDRYSNTSQPVRVTPRMSSLLVLADKPHSMECLLQKGANPGQVFNLGAIQSLPSLWRKRLHNAGLVEKQAYLPMHQTLAQHWKNPDLAIDAFIGAIQKATASEIRVLLSNSPAALPFQFRQNITEDTPFPSIYTELLRRSIQNTGAYSSKTINFVTIAPVFDLIKHRLHEKTPDGDTWLQHTLFHLNPLDSDETKRPITFYSKLTETAAYKQLWHPTMFSPLNSGELPPSAFQRTVVQPLGDLLAVLFDVKHGKTSPSMFFSALRASDNKSNGLCTPPLAVEFGALKSHVWRAPYNDTTLLGHFCSLYSAGLRKHAPTFSNGSALSYAKLFQDPLFMLTASMSSALFGPVADSQAIESALGHTELLESRLATFKATEQQAVLDYLFVHGRYDSSNGGLPVAPFMERYLGGSSNTEHERLFQRCGLFFALLRSSLTTFDFSESVLEEKFKSCTSEERATIESEILRKRSLVLLNSLEYKTPSTRTTMKPL
jgi:hypothetical protein